MLIHEVTQPGMDKLMAMVQLLSGRAANTGAERQISVQAFLNLAQSMGISIHKDDLNVMLSQPPLSNMFEPMDPASPVLRFKGNTSDDVGMPPDQAREIVAKNAKAAAKRS